MKKKKSRYRKYIPKSLRRARAAHKVMKSVQKHQDAYLTAVSGIVHAAGKIFR